MNCGARSYFIDNSAEHYEWAPSNLSSTQSTRHWENQSPGSPLTLKATATQVPGPTSQHALLYLWGIAYRRQLTAKYVHGQVTHSTCNVLVYVLLLGFTGSIGPQENEHGRVCWFDIRQRKTSPRVVDVEVKQFYYMVSDAVGGLTRTKKSQPIIIVRVARCPRYEAATLHVH